MLDFPSNPSVGDVYVGPQGQQWMWDGVKWAFVGSSGGGGGGPPFQGVTDGSNAAPGDIGEFISVVPVANITYPSGTQIQSSLSLTAGDWELGGFQNLNSIGAGWIAMTANIVATPGGTLWNGNVMLGNSPNFCLLYGTVRYSGSVPTNVTFNVTASITGGGPWGVQGLGGVTGLFWARRMR